MTEVQHGSSAIPALVVALLVTLAVVLVTLLTSPTVPTTGDPTPVQRRSMPSQLT